MRKQESVKYAQLPATEKESNHINFDSSSAEEKISRLRSEIIDLRWSIDRLRVIVENLLTTERDSQGRPFVKKRASDGRGMSVGARPDSLS